MSNLADMTAEEMHERLAPDFTRQELAYDDNWIKTLETLVAQARIFEPDLTEAEEDQIWDTLHQYLWTDR